MPPPLLGEALAVGRSRLRGCTKTSLPIEPLHRTGILRLCPGALADDDRLQALFGQQLHQGLGFRAELGLGEGPMAFFAARRILDAGKVDVEPLGPCTAEGSFDLVKDGSIVGLGCDAAQRAGVRWPKSMQGVMRSSTLQSSSTSSSVPNWPILPMVSGQRVMSEKPASSSAVWARRRVSSAFSRAASRLCLPQLPE